ncbi:unnamed protein product [Musa acuminata subsp. malaccensis]|uniref:Uncharacterized protein n=1 Tax=Musa balbisiana TaxID=52838 RepID=A0A4S8I6T3_MUSBA|nr:hypothetical protein C4D60_Mb00t09630 [Musa balbisiana]CAG1865790.1 unnamed protein product [Musa acuminata subsp. malaccensis]CAG1865860.1 unnamed protein product [Musa acuminata subsp. malaccensis]
MPRSRINANFIDKTSSIVANILLRIIPTTSGEKKAFTYYRDDSLNRMNDRNGCWLNPKEIMRKLYRIIMKLRDQKLIPMIEVIYSIT